MARARTNSRQELFAYRYGAAPAAPEPSAGGDTLAYLAGRRSCRDYRDRAVDPALVETLAAAAFCAPTKSDLQQRDLVIVHRVNSTMPNPANYVSLMPGAAA